jgi:hypothetical protein
MPKSEHSEQIAVTIGVGDRHIYEAIVARAARLGPRYRPASFVMDMLRWWDAQGQPAISPQDQAMMIAAKMPPKAYPRPHAQNIEANESGKR